MIESLEKRELLSANVGIVGSVLKIIGTPHSDVILVDQKDGKASKFSVIVNDVEYKIDVATTYDFPGDDDSDTVKKSAIKRITKIEVWGDPEVLVASYDDGGYQSYGGDDFIALSKRVWVDSTLRGGHGNDTMIGGSGEDTFIGGFKLPKLSDAYKDDGKTDDDGFDTVDYSHREDPLRLTLNNVPDDGKFGEKDNITTSIDEIIGGQSDDLIVGDKKDNVLDGQYGNDVILGLDGHDTIYGSHGNDSIRGGDGDDVLLGHSGNDTVYGDYGDDLIEVNDGERDTAVGGAGWDVVFADTKDLLADIEKWILIPDFDDKHDDKDDGKHDDNVWDM